MVSQASKPVFVIAEAGVNHNGNLGLALKLCDAAKAAGADAVKFQTFRAEDLVAPDAPSADYQRTQTGATKQFDMLKALELDQAAHVALFKHCQHIGIECFSTPFSSQALHMLVRLGVSRLKLSSAELNHPQLIQAAVQTGLPLILSTGMGSLAEVRQAIDWCKQVNTGNLAEQVSVLHCTSAYPAPDSALNLRAMQTLATEFGLPVGYSDHSQGPEASLAAVALGAQIIEKHLTLDQTMVGPDHQASMEPAAFATMVASIRRISAMLGDGIKAPNQAEQNTALVARRSVVIAGPVAAGTALTEDKLALRRPATGIAPADLPNVLGRAAVRNLSAGHVLQWSDLGEGA